jgi:hypothetical protein
VRSRFGLRLPFAPEDRAKAFSGLALAFLTVLATVVAGLQTDASTQAASGKRLADRLAIETAGLVGQLQLQSGTQYSIWERWYEQVQRNSAATEASQANPEGPRAAVLKVLSDADQKIADWMVTQSVLLQPPYYDAATLRSDFDAYNAIQFLQPTVLADQRQKAENAVAVRWDARSSDYITILTIIAVALFFFGLGSQLRRPARSVLAVAGVGLGVLALGWAAVLSVAPMPRVPDQAIQNVAEAAAEWAIARSQPNDLTADEKVHYEKAISLADAAVTLDPTLASAREQRADARISYSEQLRFLEGRSQAADDLAAGALVDYQAAVDADPSSYITWANLGWAAFLTDDLPRALSATDRSLSLAATDSSLWVQRAAIREISGDQAGAIADVEAGLKAAVETAQDSGAYGLALSRFYLVQLAEERPDHADRLRAMERRIAEASVAVAVRGTPDVPTTVPAIDSVDLMTLRISPDGSVRESQPAVIGVPNSDPDAVGYRLRLRSSAVPEGSTVSARLTIGDIEEAGYNTDLVWPKGQAEATLDLLTPYGKAHYVVDPGAYRLHVYIDGARVQTLEWSVPRERGPALVMTNAQVVEDLKSFDWHCSQETTAEGLTDTCDAHIQGVRYVATLVQVPDTGALVEMQFQAVSDDTTPVLDNAKDFFKYMLEGLFGTEQGDDLMTWVAERGPEFGQIRARGVWLQSSGEGETQRAMTILP